MPQHHQVGGKNSRVVEKGSLSAFHSFSVSRSEKKRKSFSARKQEKKNYRKRFPEREGKYL